MKFFLFLIVGLISGYLLYPYLNPPSQDKRSELVELFHKFLMEEAKDYAESTDPQNKLQAADRMYRRMSELVSGELELPTPKNQSANILVNVSPEASAPKKFPEFSKVRSPEPDLQTVAEKYHSNALDRKTILTFNTYPYLSREDSRVLKLVGSFEGKIKLSGAGRTGEDEKIVLAVNQDVNKEMTRAEISDNYDNVNFSYFQKTSMSFKSVPGDENLLLLQFNDGNIIFDLRSFPTLKGKVLSNAAVSGEFELMKRE